MHARNDKFCKDSYIYTKRINLTTAICTKWHGSSKVHYEHRWDLNGRMINKYWIVKYGKKQR
jgi:hypothetical protein